MPSWKTKKLIDIKVIMINTNKQYFKISLKISLSLIILKIPQIFKIKYAVEMQARKNKKVESKSLSFPSAINIKIV